MSKDYKCAAVISFLIHADRNSSSNTDLTHTIKEDKQTPFCLSTGQNPHSDVLHRLCKYIYPPTSGKILYLEVLEDS